MNWVKAGTHIVNNNTLQRVLRPPLCVFVTNWACNCACVMCDVWKRDKKTLSLEQIKEIFSKKLHFLDFVKITGGEPFLRKDLSQIVESIQKSVDLSLVYITTNGFFTDRVVELAERCGSPKLLITVSIDAVGELHDKIRVCDGAYDAAIKTLSELVKRREKSGFRIKVNQTIIRENKDQIEPVRKVVTGLGVQQIEVMIAQDQEPGVDIRTHDSFARIKTELSQSELKAIFEELEPTVGAEGDLLSRSASKFFNEGLKNRLLHRNLSPRLNCVSLSSYFRLLPNGDVATCSFHLDPIGNLATQSFEEVWYGEKADQARGLVRKCSGCWSGCEVTPSAAYTGAMLKGLLA